MPQFDLLSFFAQIFWILVIFNIFFDTLDSKYLPLMFQTLKLREKRLTLNETNSVSKVYYYDLLTESYINFIKNTYFNNFK
jgi:hypothetical protein